MKAIAVALLVVAANANAAPCPEKLQRNPDYLALAVDDKAPRPSSVDDFKFIGETTTLDELQSKVGPPDGTIGSRRFLWCLASGTIIEVESRKATEINSVRVDGKATWKRK